MTPGPAFPSLVQDFFVQRLMHQRNSSARTVASYRDALCLLLRHAEAEVGKPPTALTLADLDAPLVLAFLDRLEKERGNSVRTRNLRLAAIRSFLHYAALRDPTALPTIQRVFAIPLKRFDRPLLGFLSRAEMDAVLAAPDITTWSGHRDHAMLATLYNTGARASEIVAIRVVDAQLERALSVRIRGKGRKERMVPLWKETANTLKSWLRRLEGPPEGPLFPNRDGAPLSRFGVVKRLQAAVHTAAQKCPALEGRRVSPHTFRHTTAMHMLQSGVDFTNIAMWLGHESLDTTHQYVEANVAMKRKALEKLDAPAYRRARFRPTDRLLGFLEGL